MKISINVPKPKYQVWPEYNKSLKQWGSVTFWFSEDVREKWLTHDFSYFWQGLTVFHPATASLKQDTHANQALFDFPPTRSISYSDAEGFEVSGSECLIPPFV